MPTEPLTPDSIAQLLEPYLGQAVVATQLFSQLAVYLKLILRWNVRVNLTAIRGPEEIVQRHFGESLFAGLHLGACDSLLDLGSGAGFPGIPIQLLRPDLPITLAEARHRKTAFLRETIRGLGLPSEVWAGRAEAMPSERRFDTVALRAVDEMSSAVAEASRRARDRVLILGTESAVYPTLAAGFCLEDAIRLPNSKEGALWIARAGQG